MNTLAAFPRLCLTVGRPEHLVHVGAHAGQEVGFYRQAGARRITLVEPNPQLAAQLRADFPDASVVQCACGSAPGRGLLHLMEPSNMSTLAAPQPVDRVTGCIEVEVRRLDDIAPDADTAVIDVQGRELDVLAAAPWASLRVVVVETCTVDDPTMASPHDQVDAFMAGRGFGEVERWTRPYDDVSGWARGAGVPPRGGEVRDVVYVRGAG
ncbi:FkbM family methyltransferase [Streptomyces brasiliscabiei]|uniref:FkbM family methyltransferase n=1 Tax=Streptomyces brasiliscabiei TaxID=2736302 RepID=A0ABU8G9T8_9ACTN